jgi:DNA-binding transcriptional MerR regulator
MKPPRPIERPRARTGDEAPALHSVGRLARLAGLSRSTLLYYDGIGLLRPCARSKAGYRLYDEAARERLASIRRYRDVGLTLEEVREILAGTSDRTDAILDRRLEALGIEIGRLREQQRVIAKLLHGRVAIGRSRALTKARWVELLRATGLGDDDMNRWHVEFEAMAPEAHQDFLESLGIRPSEIAAIRARSRARPQKKKGTPHR